MDICDIAETKPNYIANTPFLLPIDDEDRETQSSIPFTARMGVYVSTNVLMLTRETYQYECLGDLFLFLGKKIKVQAAGWNWYRGRICGLPPILNVQNLLTTIITLRR